MRCECSRGDVPIFFLIEGGVMVPEFVRERRREVLVMLQEELVKRRRDLPGGGTAADEVMPPVPPHPPGVPMLQGLPLAGMETEEDIEWYYQAKAIQDELTAITSRTNQPCCDLKVVDWEDAKPAAVEWLWPGKLAIGEVTALYGARGMGKTRLMLDLAARVSTGAAWPDGTPAIAALGVVILNAGDPVKTCVSPCLVNAGASLDNILAIEAVFPKPEVPDGRGRRSANTEHTPAAERPFDLGCDMLALRDLVEGVGGGLRLVVIDAIESLCGRKGPSKARVRTILADLEQMARDYQVAVVVISAEKKCDLPVKNVWRVDCDALEPDLHCWVQERCHHGPSGALLGFRLTEKGMAWEPAGEAPPVDRLQGADRKQVQSRQLKEQVEWLKRELLDGPRPATEILAAGSAAGWSRWQVKRAKRTLNARCYKELKQKGRWLWDLPIKPDWPVINGVHYFGAVAGAQSDAEVLERMEKQLKGAPGGERVDGGK